MSEGETPVASQSSSPLALKILAGDKDDSLEAAPRLSLAPLGVWSVALRSCDERDLYWCRALRGSKVPGAECNNQSSPALIRYLRASGSAIEYLHHLSHAFKHGECRQSYENLKRPPVIKDTRASRCVCVARLDMPIHTLFQHVTKYTTLTALNAPLWSKPGDLIDPIRVFYRCRYDYTSRFQVHVVKLSGM